MRKLLATIVLVSMLMIGFLIGINARDLTASAIARSLASISTNYTIPFTVTMLADIGTGQQQTVTIPLTLNHTFSIESLSSDVLEIESNNPMPILQPAATVDNIGIPYTLINATDVEVRWLVREFGGMAILEGTAINQSPDDGRVVDSLIVAVTFYDQEGKFLTVSDMQPVPYRESELPFGEDVRFEIYSHDDAPFADIGSYTVQVEASYGAPKKRRGD